KKDEEELDRLLLSDRLEQAILHADLHRHSIAVAYIDLDGFKEVNNRHGHNVGDQLLQLVSPRMLNPIRGLSGIEIDEIKSAIVVA
ncbi:MAG: diguanylate cyclase, partial [Sulfuricurvum sp.]|nr:diguanylate cyclase [Sulfuricurvum sp.]